MIGSGSAGNHYKQNAPKVGDFKCQPLVNRVDGWTVWVFLARLSGSWPGSFMCLGLVGSWLLAVWLASTGMAELCSMWCLMVQWWDPGEDKCLPKCVLIPCVCNHPIAQSNHELRVQRMETQSICRWEEAGSHLWFSGVENHGYLCNRSIIPTLENAPKTWNGILLGCKQ